MRINLLLFIYLFILYFRTVWILVFRYVAVFQFVRDIVRSDNIRGRKSADGGGTAIATEAGFIGSKFSVI